MNTRNSFILHKDSLKVLNKLSDEQAGKLFKTIQKYQDDGKIEQLDFALDLVFDSFLNQFKRDEEKYQKTCEARRIAGSEGGKQKVANASKSKQKVANLADSDSDSDSESESKSKNDSGSGSKKEKSFIIPTIEEIKNYCKEKNYTINAKYFFDYYSTNDWKNKDGKPVKNWKQTVVTWQLKQSGSNSVATKMEITKTASQILKENILSDEKPADYEQVMKVIRALVDYGEYKFRAESKIYFVVEKDEQKQECLAKKEELQIALFRAFGSQFLFIVIARSQLC